ncbi:hypothetical protein BB497_15785 [Halomonas sp. GFAJ-1]|nr:hypothetical protein BB497_15785 [Halomonas sp. GFAJ-1]
MQHFKKGNVALRTHELADIMIITRKGPDNFVLMSLVYHHSLMETVHLLRSPRNATHLSRSIEQYRNCQI